MRERLPTSPARLIGRERELADLRALLGRGARLITLTGAGGSGKTALALAFAQSIADHFASSAFVDLSDLRDPSFVPQAIATAALAPRSAGGETAFEALIQHIGAERTLLLLDNYEQLLPASAVVSDLLSACASLVVIVTSRTPLELRWEHVYHVGPLDVPTVATASPSALRAVPSVALFVERARAVKPIFALDASNARQVHEVVTRLDGLPLAIELAAARLRILSVSELADRVHTALDLLHADHGDRPPRQRTMRATIDWSLALLTDRQRRILSRLAIFEDGAMLDAVRSVCVEESEVPELVDDLDDLVQAGVVTTTEVDGETRFRLPATVRERAIELLEASGERSRVADRHARFFKRLCVGLSSDEVDEAVWLARAQVERENIRGALRHAFAAPPSDREPAMQIVYSMLAPWFAQGAIDEATRWIDLALAAGKETPQWSLICCEAGIFARLGGDLARAEQLFRTALEIHTTHNRDDRAIFQIEGLARVATDRGDEATAREMYANAMELAEAVHRSRFDRAAGRWRWADCLHFFGHPDVARVHCDEALRLARTGNAPQATTASLTLLGDLARERGDLAEARALLDEAWDLVGSIRHHIWRRNVLTSMIRLAHEEGDGARAGDLATQSLTAARAAGDRTVSTAAWIDALAFAALSRAQHEAAARLFGFAEGFRDAIGAVLPPVERPARERALALVRAALGARAPVEVRADASIASVFAFAETVFAAAQPSAITLSRREREVAALVARGLSNRAIAERLILGERTVETHVERVLRKLEVRSRHDVAMRAQELLIAL